MEVRNLLDISTREELYRWYQDNHDKVSDFWLRVNRASADCPGVIRYVDAVEVALCFGWIDSTQKKIDEGKPVIKIDRIQHYKNTDREEYGLAVLQRFIAACHAGKMQPGWSDFGRLEEF